MTQSTALEAVLLYMIMVTGAMWEKHVFGRFLFAHPFLYEDAVSIGVMVLHTVYLWGLFATSWTHEALMWLALVAYAAYAVNAAQFVWKFMLARRQREGEAAVPVLSGSTTAHA